jgi:hypothetical protein
VVVVVAAAPQNSNNLFVVGRRKYRQFTLLFLVVAAFVELPCLGFARASNCALQKGLWRPPNLGGFSPLKLCLFGL